jgi:hypothetical protein
MATIKELRVLLLSIPGVSEQVAAMIVSEMRRAMPGEKLYIPAIDTSRKDEIAEAVKTLPTSVVAERFGVHPSWPRKLASRGVTRRR